jgi:hypothetical protein
LLMQQALGYLHGENPILHHLALTNIATYT